MILCVTNIERKINNHKLNVETYVAKKIILRNNTWQEFFENKALINFKDDNITLNNT